jgi:CheY-like chemotaxis protein
MAAPRILIVDDQRDITRMLRTALETLGHGYRVADVPSAEEAQLETRRGPIDLLITDLRLPGISGLELIHKLRRSSVEAPMIVISAYADERTRAEIVGVGATFFSKPLNLGEFLAAVQKALGSRVNVLQPEPEAAADGVGGLGPRLARLRRDLGAQAIGLVDAGAQLIARDGDFGALDLGAVLSPLLTAFGAARTLSAALGGLGPNSLTYIDGRTHDLYLAGVGSAHALLICFDGERGATQMGPVLRYGRQAADELVRLLPGGEAPAAPAKPLPATARLAPSAPAAPAEKKLAPSRAAAVTAPLIPQPRPAAPALTAAELAHLDEAAKQVTSESAAAFWDAAGLSDLGDSRADIISFEQANEQGLLDKNKKK